MLPLSLLTIFIAASSSAAPNFILIFLDDLGWNDVEWHGSSNAYTPHLTNLLSESLELNRFYTTSKCAPTRVTLMTGRYTHHTGMQHANGLTSRMACGIEQHHNNLFWSQRLQSCQNYKNHYLGKWHMGYFRWTYTPLFRGFDSFLGFYHSSMDYTTFSTGNLLDWHDNNILRAPLPTETYSTDVFADRAISIIKQKSNSNDDTPFTITLGFNAPHSPIHQPPHTPTWRSILDQHRIFDSTLDVQRKDYVAMVAHTDERIADIINTLKTESVNGVSIWDNTWVWISSDNGGGFGADGSNYPLRGAKATLFEGGIRVPAMITGGLLPASLRGQRTEELMHVTDIYHTMCTQSGSNCDDLPLDGRDLTDLIEDNGRYLSSGRSIIVNVNNYNCAGRWNGHEVCGAIIKTTMSGMFKAVIGGGISGTSDSYAWKPLNVQNALGSPTVDCGNGNQPVFNAAFRRNDCAAGNTVCLFNLSLDPCEYQNLSGDLTFSAILNELMMELLAAYNHQTPTYVTYCATSGIGARLAGNTGGYIPWAENFFGDNKYSVDNEKPLDDVCPVTP